ncbi:MAG: hypothetical protein ACTSRZ_17120 [Promethearchaeota archaeon]
MSEEFKDMIEKLNKAISNPIDTFKTLQGYEIILEALVYKIYDLFGRNALLSMTYQIGAGPGEVIADRLLKEKNVDKIEDPFEAFALLLNENRDYYNVYVLNVSEELTEVYGKKYKKLTFFIRNKCFFRESLKKRSRLKIGGPLCRINKAYFEVAFKKLTGLKNEISFVQNDEDNDVCLETVAFFIPIE